MELVDSYLGTRLAVHTEFSALHDYIWKSPRLIEAEIEIERRKLDAYFPKQGDPIKNKEVERLRRLRAIHEGANLWIRFPGYMAASNLFLAASMFEHFLARFCREVESRSESRLKDERGNGVDRYFKFLRGAGCRPEENPTRPQVDAAIELRNALLHADGEIEFCRNRSKLEMIVKKQLFITPPKRAGGGQEDSDGWPEVAIIGDPPKIRINNFYAFRASGYFREFLLDLGKRINGSGP